MPSRRLFNGDSKTPLENLCLSHEELTDRLSVKDGLQSLILENNRDHIISGKQYNTAGYVLQLIEHPGRRCTVGEVVAASDGDLTERSVSSSITSPCLLQVDTVSTVLSSTRSEVCWSIMVLLSCTQ